MATDSTAHDPLDDFDKQAIELLGATRNVQVAGRGPAVIVMAEMPGITPYVARFARWVRDAGFTVYMPSLFGRDGAMPEPDEDMAVLRRACASAQFRAYATGEARRLLQAGRGKPAQRGHGTLNRRGRPADTRGA